MSKVFRAVRKVTPNPKGLRKNSASPSVNTSTGTVDGTGIPTPGETPELILRVQVVGCSDLIAKDKNGKSDPFVVVSLARERYTTPVIKKTLDPTFPPDKSTFDFPIHRSTVGYMGALQFVVWDKDLLKKEYLGEVALPFDEWFKQREPSPAFGFDDERNAEFPAQMVSTRKNTASQGVVHLKIGFVPVDASSPVPDYATLFADLVKLANTTGQTIHSSVPTRGIGTTVEGESDLEDDGLSSGDDYSSDEFDGIAAAPKMATPLSQSQSQGIPIPARKSSAGMSPSPGTKPLPSPSFLPKVFTPGGTSRRESYTPGAESSDNSRPASRAGKKRPSFKKNFESSYNLASKNDIVGIVMIDVQGAEDLPKLKNMTRTGWDMDPFLVISFGKKVFRTRVIRHSLNPTWNEKLLFHVHRYETNFKVDFKVLDWDKLSGNDQIGSVSFDLPELMANVPKADPETGIYPIEVAKGEHDMTDYSLPIATDKSVAWEFKHSPTLKFRAKYQPYRALRQRFWRQYLKQYDADNNDSISHLELTSMLDSLGSTLSRDTIDSFFVRFNVSPRDGNITFEQAILCLEEAVHMPASQRKRVSTDDQVPDTGTGTTPLLTDSPTGAMAKLELDFSGPSARPPNDEAVPAAVLQSMPLPGNNQTATNKPVDLTVPTPPGNNSRSVSEQTIMAPDSASATPQPGVPGAVPTVTAHAQLLAELDEDGGSPGSSSGDSETVVERVINIKTCPLCHRPRMNSKAETDIVTHLAVCASSDWARVDRMLVGNYVTPSQAQRKWYSKVITKVSAGAYEIGANSANIIVQNRKTGQLEEEKMQGYVRLGIRLLYKGAKSRMEGGRARKLLKSMSVKQGLKFDSPDSAREILPFIAFHNLNVNEILDPLESFTTFNQFFYRKLKDSARPVTNPDDPYTLVSVADCRMMAFESVQEATRIWIKGREFSVENLLGEAYKDEAHRYHGGALGIFRLAPQDYHRFHVPVDGTIGKMTYIAGEYYTVNPQAIRTSLDVYGENARKIVPIDSPQFGKVMAVCVGAMMVGTIVTTVEEGAQVKRGDEFGYFAFGGSTIVLLFEKGMVEWDEDLLINGKACLETLVTVRSGVGKSLKPKA